MRGPTDHMPGVARVRRSRYPGNGQGLLDTFAAQVVFVVTAEIDHAFWGDLQDAGRDMPIAFEHIHADGAVAQVEDAVFLLAVADGADQRLEGADGRRGIDELHTGLVEEVLRLLQIRLRSRHRQKNCLC